MTNAAPEYCLMARAAQGGAFESRGRFFTRVTVAKEKRRAVLVPSARSLGDAEQRAIVLQGLVDALREAGQLDFIDTTLEQGAILAADKLPTLQRVVAGIVDGSEKRAAGSGQSAAGETFLPQLGAEKAKSVIYPSEESQLMACTTVPLESGCFGASSPAKAPSCPPRSSRLPARQQAPRHRHEQRV